MEILQRAIDHYGLDKQIMVFLGELGELYEAMLGGNPVHIVDELADVDIMLEQRFLISGCPKPLPIDMVPGIYDLSRIIAGINKYEARLVQGREYSWVPVKQLLDWMEVVIRDNGCTKLHRDRIEFKLKRLQERLDALQEN